MWRFDATSTGRGRGKSFDMPAYDEIVISYTGSEVSTVVYKLDSGTVATLTLSYTGDNLTGVVKT